ncbi:MAG TPA: hypothetical protein VFZ17_05345 [Acidimicrobiia bacterium]|nr:hypothetical protein [Acidimicrobiia bacterium]
MSPGIRKGEPWGSPWSGPPDLSVSGTDAALAAAVAAHPDSTIAWTPASGADFARAVSLGGDAATRLGLSLPCDALAVRTGASADGTEMLAVNAVVVGTGPDRTGRLTRNANVRVTADGRLLHEGAATGVLVGNGQFLRGTDVVPRGHPGDGRVEIQVYAVPAGERSAMRRRLPHGTHVPHPGIRQASARSTVEVDVEGQEWPLELDGVEHPAVTSIEIRVVAQRFALLI